MRNRLFNPVANFWLNRVAANASQDRLIGGPNRAGVKKRRPMKALAGVQVVDRCNHEGHGSESFNSIQPKRADKNVDGPRMSVGFDA
jgi:hypothetical protein